MVKRRCVEDTDWVVDCVCSPTNQPTSITLSSEVEVIGGDVNLTLRVWDV